MENKAARQWNGGPSNNQRTLSNQNANAFARSDRGTGNTFGGGRDTSSVVGNRMRYSDSTGQPGNTSSGAPVSRSSRVPENSSTNTHTSGQTLTSRNYVRNSRGSISGASDGATNTPRGQSDANHPDPGQRPSPASMVPHHMVYIAGHPPVHPGLQRSREDNPALRTNGLPTELAQQGLPLQQDMGPRHQPPRPRARTIPEDDYPVQN